MVGGAVKLVTLDTIGTSLYFPGFSDLDESPKSSEAELGGCVILLVLLTTVVVVVVIG